MFNYILKKFLFIFIFFIPIITINLISNKCDSNSLFPVIFSIIGIINSFAGILLLNDNKKILSFSNFLLAGFFFITVAAKVMRF